ncbi:hypothetical protein ACWCOV_09295 [Kribbella sp. NPDC002412]
MQTTQQPEAAQAEGGTAAPEAAGAAVADAAGAAVPAAAGAGGREVVVGTAVVRIHSYAVDPDKLAEFLERRAKVIGVIRDAHPGLTSTQLVRLEDGSYSDTWRWESFQAMAAAFPLAQSPEAVAAWSLVSAPPTATNAEVIDER